MPLLDENKWREIYIGNTNTTRNRAVFLDRDGVIIAERNSLGDPDKVELCPGAAGAILAVRLLGIPIIVVTNQSGIGRGLFGWTDYEAVHRRMLELLNIDNPFSAVYANSYVSNNKDADWRKPNPGMLLQAIADNNICAKESIMVGDKVSDLQAGRNAGVTRLVHVRTGHGQAEQAEVTRLFPFVKTIETIGQLPIDYINATVADETK